MALVDNIYALLLTDAQVTNPNNWEDVSNIAHQAITEKFGITKPQLDAIFFPRNVDSDERQTLVDAYISLRGALSTPADPANTSKKFLELEYFQYLYVGSRLRAFIDQSTFHLAPEDFHERVALFNQCVSVGENMFYISHHIDADNAVVVRHKGMNLENLIKTVRDAIPKLTGKAMVDFLQQMKSPLFRPSLRETLTILCDMRYGEGVYEISSEAAAVLVKPSP